MKRTYKCKITISKISCFKRKGTEFTFLSLITKPSKPCFITEFIIPLNSFGS